MRFSRVFCGLLLAASCLSPHVCGQESVKLATHTQAPPTSANIDAEAIQRIRRIVLSQGDDARALANLVQLARTLPAAANCQLYCDLSTDYLKSGKYNQAASVLQQLLNQHPTEPHSKAAVVRLVRLYSSGEVAHCQSVERSAKLSAREKAGLSKYALHVAGTAVMTNQTLANDPALTFQRAVAMRNQGRPDAARGALTRIKRDPQAEPWRTRALAENWLTSDRKEDAPLATVQCHRTEEHPHLDGVLDESFWQADESVQLAYNDSFLYLAVTYPKHKTQGYATDLRARTYDADLTAHDRVQLKLDIDRDYSTAYELTIDHRGWTNDRCWLETAWNPKWFVAASTTDTHWSIEAAIPFEALTNSAPRPGDAWAFSALRQVPDETKSARVSLDETFKLLLFQ